MAVRDIRLFGDPVLKSQCPAVESFDDNLAGLVKDLLETVALPGRAGVAAPQIGVSLRAFSYNVEGKTGHVINPDLQVDGEWVEEIEGCLSLPELGFFTPRRAWARVTGFDLKGRPITLEGEGLMARMLQHECDHLAGTLYIDRLPQPARREAMKALRESSWFLR